MNWVDLVLLVALVVSAVHGLRLGAMVQVLTFAGFLLGFTLGALLSIALVSSLRPGPVKESITLILVLGLALVLAAAGRILGGWTSVSLRRHHLAAVDSALGVVVAMVAVLLSAWLVASVLSDSRYTWLENAIDDSGVLHTVAKILPPVPSIFSHVQAFLNSEGFPSVFAGLPPSTFGTVNVPSQGEAEVLEGLVAASTVKVLGQACGEVQEGTAFVVAPRTVITNAHVVAGETQTQVQVGTGTYPATVVLFNPEFDLAVLRTNAPLGRPLVLDPVGVGRGTKGAVVGYPENGPLTAVPAGVVQPILAEGRDIYNDGLVTRNLYQIDALVRPGNSGSPLVAGNGTVIGVVFSRSTVDPNVGYALASPGVLSIVQGTSSRTAPVSTQGCTSE